MDFKIATALNLSPELVWFSRQSYAEELSSSSSDHGPGLFSQDCRRHYGRYFPEIPHDIGSRGTQSPGRDDTDEEAESTGDDFSHALFAQEQMILEDDFGFGEAMDVQQPASPAHGHQQLSIPSLSPINSSLSPSPSSPVIEISYTPSSPSPYPELMVASSPVQMETLMAPVTVSRLQNFSNRRRQPLTVAAWQRAILRGAFTFSRQPGRGQLRELSQRTHLPVSEVSRWFAEQRRILLNQIKFGFSFASPASRTTASRRILITTTGHYNRH